MRDFVIGNTTGPQFRPAVFRFERLPDISLARLLEKPTVVTWLASRTVIFNCEQSMPWWSQFGVRVFEASTTRTMTRILLCRAFENQRALALGTFAKPLQCLGFVQLPTACTNHHIFRMPSVFGEKISRKEVYIGAASGAGLHFHPQEVLDRDLR
jgi:hypothetical protein